MTTILSIQSSVAYGHVGNSAATFPLMRLGYEVWPVLTVHFSNNTSYPSKKGPLLKPSDVADVIEGIDELGVLPQVDAVLSGYQGAPAMGAEIIAAVERVKAANPHAIYCADPVMGDVGRGMYVLPGIPEFIRDEVVPHADIMTPNHFELDFLTGRTTTTLADIVDAAHALRRQGPTVVVVTSVEVDETPDGVIQMVAVTEEGACIVQTPRIDYTYTGSGDLTTAVFLAAYFSEDSVLKALSRTADEVYSVLEVTKNLGRRELALVAAQELLINPAHHFEARELKL